MTSANSIGVAVVYEFHSGEKLLVRVSELAGDMRTVVQYMASKCGGIKRILEPELATRPIRFPLFRGNHHA